MIEEIKFNSAISIWKSVYSFKDLNSLIEECNDHITKYIEKSMDAVKVDAYGYFETNKPISTYFEYDSKKEMDMLVCFGVNKCIELYRTLYGSNFNTLYTDNWVNVVRSIPRQEMFNFNGDINYHTHKELNKKSGRMEPDFTYIIYIQMPDKLDGDDGVLFLRDCNGVTHKYLPQSGDCIIMKGDVEHVPNHAPKSTLDRIVMAGNVSLKNNKTNKTIL